ncbi:1-acyl-sn-glycerol-3-phosphate acyltransferase, partial [Pseudomonas poae]
MELATQAVNAKTRDAYYWRLFATAASFFLFGLGGLCLRLLVFPLLSCLPGGAARPPPPPPPPHSPGVWVLISRIARGGGRAHRGGG